jgi:hypothetical protein
VGIYATMRNRKAIQMKEEYLEFYNESEEVVKFKAQRAYLPIERFVESQILFTRSNLMIRANLITLEKWLEYVSEIFYKDELTRQLLGLKRKLLN